MTAAAVAAWLRARAGWALPLSLAVLLLAHAPALLDPGVILDNTRQYGPPLVADRLADGWLATQPQVDYFHAATPRLFRWLVAALPLPVVPATKLYALVLLVPLAAIAWGLGRTLLRDSARAAAFAVLLLANAVFSNQMLTGTPRDLGTVLFLGFLLALIQRRWPLALAALLPLVGIYPTFGLLALACFWLSLLPELRRPPRPLLPLLASLPVAALGLRLLGPTIDPAVWGPTFRLFDPSGTADLVRLSVAAEGGGPSVARLLGFVPTPAHLLALLGDKRFRFLPAPGEHAFGWLASPLVILLLAALVAGLPLLLRRGEAGLLRERWRGLAPRLAWPARVLLALALASLALYGLSFGLAFRLHNPNRYGMMPAVLALSAAELLLLVQGPALLAALLPGRGGSGRLRAGGLALALLPWLLALSLPLLRAPVDPLPVPAPALAAVARELGGPRPQLLVVGGGRSLAALANALPLTQGVRVFYAEEMDRGFHQRAIREALELRVAQRRFSALVQRQDPRLQAELQRQRIAHLLARAPRLQPLAARPDCLKPVPGDLAVLATDCLAPAPAASR